MRKRKTDGGKEGRKERTNELKFQPPASCKGNFAFLSHDPVFLNGESWALRDSRQDPLPDEHLVLFGILCFGFDLGASLEFSLISCLYLPVAGVTGVGLAEFGFKGYFNHGTPHPSRFPPVRSLSKERDCWSQGSLAFPQWW